MPGKKTAVAAHISRSGNICLTENYIWVASNSGLHQLDLNADFMFTLRHGICMDVCSLPNMVLGLFSTSGARKGTDAASEVCFYDEDHREVRKITCETAWGRSRKLAIAADALLFLATKHDANSPAEQYSSVWKIPERGHPQRIIHACPHNLWYMAVVNSKNLLVTSDRNNDVVHTVDIYDFSGNKIRTLAYGTAECTHPPAGYIIWPRGLAVDCDDNIYVTDELRVQKYSLDKKYLKCMYEHDLNPKAPEQMMGLAFINSTDLKALLIIGFQDVQMPRARPNSKPLLVTVPL